MHNLICYNDYRYAISVNTEHFETSAKTGKGIMDLFANLAKRISSILVNSSIGIINFKKKQQDQNASKRLSNRGAGYGVDADGIDDHDDKYTLSVKLKRNRHTAQTELRYKDEKKNSKCCK